MALGKHKVLLVDDEKDVCDEFGVFLNRKGYEVFTALNGLEAIRIAKSEEHIDLVITDYHMPEVNGIELTKELKTIIPEAPVIMMSGVADMKTALQALRENAFDFLSKPVDSKELLQVMQKALSRANRKQLEEAEKKEGYTQYMGLLTHVETGNNHNVTAISIHAALDEVNLKRLRTSFEKLLAEESIHKRIVLLLNKVNYINNIGLDFLLEIHDNLRKKNHVVVFAMLSDPVYKYLKVLGYLEHFEVALSLNEAIELFK